MKSVRELPTRRACGFERIGAHTHVKGLGQKKSLRAAKVKDGMVGQERAREAAGLVVQMNKGRKAERKDSDRSGNI